MDINLMTEEQIKQHLLDRKALREHKIAEERDELYDKYKDAKYIIVHYPNSKFKAFGIVTDITKRGNDIVDIFFSSNVFNHSNENKNFYIRDNDSCYISNTSGTSVEIITEERYNELKTLFDELYNDTKFDNLFNKLKENE